MISIIIPSFNRSQLIGATLDSIMVQTYLNWECIVVDDGSNDYTDELMEFYCEKDSRIRYYHRPELLKKGANACRNYGFEKSIGEYIQWFDSDDLMVEKHLELKINSISGKDFIIAKTEYFNSNEKLPYFSWKSENINAMNYVSEKINWLTYDILILKRLAQKIKFNERLQSAQEFNYFSKLLIHSVRGKFIDDVVTLRRFHNESIRGKIRQNGLALNESRLKAFGWTFIDLKFLETSSILDILAKKIFLMQWNGKANYILPLKFYFSLIEIYGIGQFFHYLISLFLKKYFNKGYYSSRKFLNNLDA